MSSDWGLTIRLDRYVTAFSAAVVLLAASAVVPASASDMSLNPVTKAAVAAPAESTAPRTVVRRAPVVRKQVTSWNVARRPRPLFRVAALQPRRTDCLFCRGPFPLILGIGF